MLPSKVGIMFPPSHVKYHCFSGGSQPLHFYLFSSVIILELAGYLLRVYTRNMKSDPCICNSLRQAARESTAFYDEMLAPSRLKLTMFRLLKLICKHPKTSIQNSHILLNLIVVLLVETFGFCRSRALYACPCPRMSERGVSNSQNGERLLWRLLAPFGRAHSAA